MRFHLPAHPRRTTSLDVAVRTGLIACRLAGFLAGLLASPTVGEEALPENLAQKARVAATSEYDQRYLARFAVDGKIPLAGSRADRGAAWCVLKRESGDRAEFSFEWDEPVRAAEIIYVGRTAWYMSECFKDYEVAADDCLDPIARGTLEKTDRPQRIGLPGCSAKKLTIKFLDSYGGSNPGASELMVFARPLDDRQLARLVPPANQVALAAMPWVERTDVGKLRELIIRLMELHGDKYPQAAAHLARLDELQRLKTSTDVDTAVELERLEREVLLFDVDRLLAVKRYEIRASHVYTYHYEGFKPGGGLYVLSTKQTDSKPGKQGEPVELVASPDGQILDCDLSYDGSLVLFSWRREQDEGYHLWTINTDGSGLTQLTDGPWHDYNACWLPDGRIAFLSTRAPQFAYCWHAPVGVVHSMEADGSNVRKLSANYLNDFTPYVLDDGRIIYSRWEYVDKPAIPIQSLWTINPDGTCLSGYFGNRVLSPGTFMEARSIPGTGKIICTMTGHNGPTRGAIGVIDRSRGVNAQAAIRNITPDVPLPAVDRGNGNTSGSKQYSCPVPLDRLRFLVSIRGPVLARTISGGCQSVAVDAPSDGMQYFSAQPIRPRRRPPVISSAPSLEEQVPNDNRATVFLQDVYNGLEPYVARGEVKAIRVVREMQKTVRIDPSLRAFGFQFPVISCGATYAGKTVLGEVPVEPDGSACFHVPAGVPIYFMALDAQGRAVQRMRTFTHFMPGEVQGCVGCHEHRRRASPARVGIAFNKPPRDLTPSEWGTQGFDYSRIVQPVLDRHCIECHGAIEPAGRVDLTGGKTDFFNVSYDVLARENQGPRGSPYVSWIPTYNGQEQNILEVTPKAWGSPRSKLAHIVLSGHPDVLSGHTDKDGKPRAMLDDTDRRRILAWIDLNVPYYGSSETAYPDAIGCRRIYPAKLDEVLADMAKRRCAGCHLEGKIPRRVWTRITEPELNPFLLAPLARSAGGSQKCGSAVFADKQDPDYRAILATFDPVEILLKTTPRMDMPGATPSPEVCRDTQ